MDLVNNFYLTVLLKIKNYVNYKIKIIIRILRIYLLVDEAGELLAERLVVEVPVLGVKVEDEVVIILVVVEVDVEVLVVVVDVKVLVAGGVVAVRVKLTVDELTALKL